MNIGEYQKQAAGTDRVDAGPSANYSVYYLGVLGEIGSFLSEIKKSIRDGDLYTGYQENLSEELGDMLWYVARLATLHNIELQECEPHEIDHALVAVKLQGRLELPVTHFVLQRLVFR